MRPGINHESTFLKIKPVRITLVTTGCKVNRTDGEAIQLALGDLPVAWVGINDGPDLVIVNACTVTQPAERDGRIAINRGLRSGADVFVTGCLATRLAGGADDGDTVHIDPRAVVVGGTADRTAIIKTCRDFIISRQTPTSDDDNVMVPPRNVPDRRKRPTIKVQDGCDMKCSYCIVPHVRGPSTSVPLDDVKRLIDEQTLDRCPSGDFSGEIVLTGIDLGAWGRDLGGPTLAGLVSQLIDLYQLPRFRLSSIEPHGLGDDLVRIFKNSPRVCPHIHVPLQSGSDAILAAMNRTYDSAEFIERVRSITNAVEGMALGMDVIVGYPGETDDDFEDTLRVVSTLPTTYLHVFTFSPRPGTAAYGDGQITDLDKAIERGRILRRLSAQRRAEHATRLVGKVVEVVDIRSVPDGSYVEALAEDYTRVKIAGARVLEPGMSLVRIVSSEDRTAIGERIR